MKIRLMGPPDIVRAWAALIEEQFGVSGSEYPNRGRGTDIRYYADIDDRKAAELGAWDTSGVGDVAGLHLRMEELHEKAQVTPSRRELKGRTEID